MKKRILIADDEAALLRSMAFTLKRKGFYAVTAEDGKTAYKKIMDSIQQETPYDLIITDIQMPGISGPDLILKIREAGISTPVLIISGHRNKYMSADLMKAECRNYLDKPFTMNELIDHITKILNK